PIAVCRSDGRLFSTRPNAEQRSYINSSITLPDGSTLIGRPLPLRYCASGSIPRCRYIVISTSCGIFGLVLGNAPLASDSPTTRPPLIGPPARAALNTLG